jgi:RNA-directed DNA polymerase
MNVTKTGVKCSQPPAGSSHLAGSPQNNSVEHEGYVRAHNPERITQNNIINADMSEKRLLEQIVDRYNMNKAFIRVRSNRGAPGVDGINADELLQHLKETGGQLRQSILDGKYRPNIVDPNVKTQFLRI